MFGANPHRPIGLGQLHEVRQARRIGVAVALAVQKLLPLAHHSHPFIVENEDLDRQVILDGGGHFLHGHQHTSVAGYVDDQAFWMGDLHPHCGGQAITHGPQPPGGHPAVRFLEAIELRGPHLMLANFGGDVGVARPGQGIEPLDGMLWLDQALRRPIGEAPPRPPAIDLSPPGGQAVSLSRWKTGKSGGDRLNTHPRIAHHTDIHPHQLIDGGGVDIDMDFLRSWRKSVQPTCHPVVETGADSDHHVAVVHGVIGFIGAVHADHAQPRGIVRRKGTQSHQGGGYRRPDLGGEPAQGVACARS